MAFKEILFFHYEAGSNPRTLPSWPAVESVLEEWGKEDREMGTKLVPR